MDFLINKKLKIFITLMETGSFSIEHQYCISPEPR